MAIKLNENPLKSHQKQTVNTNLIWIADIAVILYFQDGYIDQSSNYFLHQSINPWWSTK